MSDAPVIRIVKKKHAHQAHHGGSWKVAYADFVTAMMAFFLVMWIISMDQTTREQIQNYFNDPASASNSPAGISKLAGGGKSAITNGLRGILPARKWGMIAKEAQQQRLSTVRAALEQKLARRPDLSRLRQHTSIKMSSSGLAIELIEAKDVHFFESGSAQLSSEARELLAIMARELAKAANPIIIEGHTDSVPYSAGAGYTNWELSADRANAARRAMEASGVRAHQVIEVRGYADSRLRDPQHPADPSNRRVAVLVKYSLPGEPAGSDGESGGPGKESGQAGSAQTEATRFDPGIRPEKLTD